MLVLFHPKRQIQQKTHRVDRSAGESRMKKYNRGIQPQPHETASKRQKRCPVRTLNKREKGIQRRGICRFKIKVGGLERERGRGRGRGR